MTFSLSQASFTGGLLDDTLSARIKLVKYGQACRKLENFIVQPSGGVYRRPGLKLLSIPPISGDEARLIPFQFNVEQTYILLFSALQIRIFADQHIVESGGSPIVVTSPYLESEVNEIQYAQSADVIFLVHPNHPPKRFERLSATSFQLVSIDFATPTQTPPTAFTSTWVGAAGTRTIKYAVTAVSDSGEESVYVTASLANGKVPAEWTTGNYVNLGWTAPVAGADSYVIYKEKQGIYGYIGTVRGTTSFVDDNFVPDILDSVPELNNPFSGAGDYPSSVALHQQRIWFGNTDNKPQTIWGSRSGSFSSMRYSHVIREDDSVELTIYSNQINEIRWLLSYSSDILVGTVGAEWRITSGVQGAITALSAYNSKQSEWGSKDIQAIMIGPSVLFVEYKGSKVYDLTYNVQVEGGNVERYMSNNLSILIPSLFEGFEIISWAYQRAPDSVLWCIRNDGVLLGLTYLKEQNIFAWHKHTTSGSFKSVASIPGELYDDVYFIVDREGESNLEIMYGKPTSSEDIEEMAFLDKCLLVDGNYIAPQYRWQLSTSGTNEYYFVFQDFTDPWGWFKSEAVVQPEKLFEDGELMPEGVIGSLAPGEWAWGDNDVITFNTIYVRLTDDTDPDTKSSNYVKGSHTQLTIPFDPGVEVYVKADGSVSSFTVDEFSTIYLPVDSFKIFIGLNYTSTLSPMGVEIEGQQGTSVGKTKSIGKVILRLKDTIGGKVGPEENYTDDLLFTPDTYDEPIEPFTGDYDFLFPADASSDGSFYIIQDQPLPMTILALIPEIYIGEG